MERLRIGLLSYEYPPDTGLGGIGTYTRTQALALARAGHEVHVLAGSPVSAAANCRQDDDVTVWRDGGSRTAHRLGALLGSVGWWWSRNRFENGLRMRSLLRRVADRVALDVIEVPECGAEGLFLGRRWESRKVVRFHSPAELIMPFYATRPGDRRLCALLERRGFLRSAAASACSQFLAREVRERLAFPSPIVTVPNGIDLETADAMDAGHDKFDLRAEIGATPAEPIVLFAGRFERRKGSVLMCELVPELLARRSVRFVVLGEDLFGEAAGELVARCGERGRARFLHRLGRRGAADVRAAMRQADVVLLPSRWENAPYSVLEAMAAGAALVASRVGGLPEMVEHECEALLAADQDVAAHLAMVERLLDDRELARSLGAAARGRVEREFSAERMAASSVEIYRRVVASAESKDSRRIEPGRKKAPLPGRLWRRLVGGLAQRRETSRRQEEYRTLLAELSASATAEAAGDAQPRLLAIGAWHFPQYSQSFVYQELAALVAAGFDVRLAYTQGADLAALPPQCAALAGRAVRLPGERAITRRDLAHFRATRPAAVASLFSLLAAATGRSEGDIEADGHVLRGFSLARIAEAWGAELLHSYFFYEGSLAAFVAQQLLGLPRGLTAYADHQLDDYALKLVALQLARADLVVATSNRVRDELEALAPSCAARLLVKPNSVDGGYFAASARNEPQPGEPFRLLSVSRIDPKKGLHDLLTAASELRRSGIPFVLDLVGGVEPGSSSGEAELAGLRAEVERRDLGGLVQLRGFLPAEAVRSALGSAHLFVAPYIETAKGDKDGIPTSLLEAMATGCAVVATRSGSIPEVVTDGVDGRLVGSGAPLELAAAMKALLLDPQERRRLGAVAAATVRKRFEIAVCEPELAERLRRLASGRGKPREAGR